MPHMTVDELADVLHERLRRMGCSRVILLGSEAEMTPGGLRTALAKRGIQVLVPPEGVRSWIASLARDSEGDVPNDEVARLRVLLEDGVEHGVEAIVCTSEAMCHVVDVCGLSVRTLTT